MPRDGKLPAVLGPSTQQSSAPEVILKLSAAGGRQLPFSLRNFVSRRESGRPSVGRVFLGRPCKRRKCDTDRAPHS
jgi:hypothetical protein